MRMRSANGSRQTSHNSPCNSKSASWERYPMRRLLVRVTVPEEGSSSPMRIRKSVVLPMPLGPTSASRAPFAIEKDTLAKRSSAPKDFEREFAVMRDIIWGRAHGEAGLALHVHWIFFVFRPHGRVGFNILVDSIPIFMIANHVFVIISLPYACRIQFASNAFCNRRFK